ncbi:MAG: hypothetical protein A3J97_09610 [Spirochaetes bacterium RIFOXYC1_FULL_54_7]|nr:MAG: hypothetical protein A3J97_09610 [Spirochaetes bacterium RIFOXYC1_FULL_54_7]
MREVSIMINQSPNTIFPVFTELGAHEQSAVLHAQIQSAIDGAEGKGFDHILLGYGLCGNALNDIRSRSLPMIAIRAHDCCTVFLGSRQRFKEIFGNELSSTWSSAGYLERGNDYIHRTDTGKLLGLDRGYDDFVKEYGEENARYIWETLHPEEKNKTLVFIDTEETASLGHRESCKKRAIEEGKSFSYIKGDTRLLKALVDGHWMDEEFLRIEPGHRINALYDEQFIIESVLQ